jgi:hypothetical protein
MAFEGDPYRTLGLARGATLDEVKRAYRRLAKANHPDAAGAGALARFLAIQAAYERLAGGSGGSVPSAGAPGPSTTRPRRAEPDRAGAARRPSSGPSRGRRRPAGGGPATAAGGGAAGHSRPGGPGGPRGPAASGPRGKATLGSTSYDGADAGPFEPDWGGASWYGTTSGTYWTINPKEYADPRKHGPEYQARARRAATGRPGVGPRPYEAPDATEPDATTSAADATASGADETATASDAPRGRGSPGRDRAASGPSHTTGSWWDSTSGSAEASTDPAGWTRVHDRANPAAPSAAPSADWPAPDPTRALADLVRALTDPRAGGLRGRILRAFIAWLPIALGLGWLFGELTGCGRFAATCDSSADPLVLGIQGAALVALVLLPVAASLATSATLGLIVAAVASAAILSATGAAADEGSRRATLGVLLLLGWIAGLSVAIAQRVRSASSRATPVS